MHNNFLMFLFFMTFLLGVWSGMLFSLYLIKSQFLIFDPKQNQTRKDCTDVTRR